MASENLRKGFTKLGESEVIGVAMAGVKQGMKMLKPVVERADEKIEVEIREIIRIRPQDFSALKNSFEEWANQWEK